MTYVILSFFIFFNLSFLKADDLKNFNNRIPIPGVAYEGLGKGDWPVYHGSYLGYSYSPLNKINKKNINKLSPAWMHQPGKVKMGLQATPIAVDGIIYYIASFNKVFAVDGFNGEQIWKYSHEFSELKKEYQGDIDENLLPYPPYSRGLAVGDKYVFFGTIDGQAVALDRKTGDVVWKKKILESDICNCFFNSPPVIAGNVILYGPAAVELLSKGAIFGLSIETGEVLWKFETLRDHPDSWLEEHREVGGGFPWMPGTYDPELDLVYYPIGNPAPDWDDGDDRPGNNLYSSSIVALDPTTGDLKWFHQQVPHDVWDFDASGEFLFLQREGKKLMSNLNKNGYVYVYDREKGSLHNIWKLSKTANWGKVNLVTGEITERFFGIPGEKRVICPWVGGVRGWGVGSYSPRTKLWYTMAQDYCNVIEIVENPERVPGNIGWNALASSIVYKNKPAPRLIAVDPVNGKVEWAKEFDTPNFGAVLTTAGGLLFYGNSFGTVYALDIDNGSTLWSFNTGSGNRAGIISYEAKGEQFILFPTGCCGFITGMFMSSIDSRFSDINEGAMMVSFKVSK